MGNWQERVRQEKRALDKKIEKLNSFLSMVPEVGVSSDDDISPKVRKKMDAQLLVMRVYSSILDDRISDF